MFSASTSWGMVFIIFDMRLHPLSSSFNESEIANICAALVSSLGSFPLSSGCFSNSKFTPSENITLYLSSDE
jgi:hypothetical protein